MVTYNVSLPCACSRQRADDHLRLTQLVLSPLDLTKVGKHSRTRSIHPSRSSGQSHRSTRNISGCIRCMLPYPFVLEDDDLSLSWIHSSMISPTLCSSSPNLCRVNVHGTCGRRKIDWRAMSGLQDLSISLSMSWKPLCVASSGLLRMCKRSSLEQRLRSMHSSGGAAGSANDRGSLLRDAGRNEEPILGEEHSGSMSRGARTHISVR